MAEKPEMESEIKAENPEIEVPHVPRTGEEDGQKHGEELADRLPSQKMTECKDIEKTSTDGSEEMLDNDERTNTCKYKETDNIKEGFSKQVTVDPTENYINSGCLEDDKQVASGWTDTHTENNKHSDSALKGNGKSAEETNEEKKEANYQDLKDDRIEEEKEMNDGGLKDDRIEEEKETSYRGLKDDRIEEEKETNDGGLKDDRIEEVKETNDGGLKDDRIEEEKEMNDGGLKDDRIEEEKGTSDEDLKDDRTEEENNTSNGGLKGASKFDCEQEKVTGKNAVSKKKDRPKPGIQRSYDPTGEGARNEKKQKKKRETKSEETENTKECQRRKKKYFHFFWRSKSEFSQWYKSPFTIDKLEYNCAEQYMMHQKALLMGDRETADIIMALDEPREQKEAGRSVQYWDQDKWDENCMSIVKQGNIAKFTQNDDLKDILFSTYPKILVEASPLDKVWGIGLSEQDSRAWDRKTWRGENRLGQILTEVRDELLESTGFFSKHQQ